MRFTFAFLTILVLFLAGGCSKSETAVSQPDTVQPVAEAVEPMPDTAASTATATATGTVTQTSVSTISEQVTPPAATTSSTSPAPKPVTSTPPPATKAPPATVPATATVAPATATTATVAAAPAPAPVPPPASAVKPATRASSGKAPKTHTVDREGIKHAPGDDNATTKCATCHGKDLKGGKVAKVSCFECHEQNWN